MLAEVAERFKSLAMLSLASLSFKTKSSIGYMLSRHAHSKGRRPFFYGREVSGLNFISLLKHSMLPLKKHA